MKDSGVERFGKIPEHWALRKVKNSDLMKISSGRFIENYDEGEFPVYGANGKIGKSNLHNVENVIVIGRVGQYAGSIIKIPEKAWVTDNGLIVKTSSEIDNGFLFYAFSSLDFNRFAQTTAQPLISQALLSQFQFCLPSPKEQKKIGDFLEKEISKMNHKLQKNKKLIELLNEKRKSIITQTITKGLDLTIPMKQSIIPGIGEIPEHWNEITISILKQMKVIIDFQDGNHGELHPRGNDFIKNGIPFLTANQINKFGKIDFKNANKLSKEFSKKLRIGFTKANDVLFTHNATVGRVGIMLPDAPNSIVGTSITYYRLNNSKLDNLFFYYLLKSDYISSQYVPIMKQSTRNQISILKQAKLCVLLPKIEEQKEIGDFLKMQSSNIDSLIFKNELQIEKIKEHITSLISSTVTGKIDVSNFN